MSKELKKIIYYLVNWGSSSGKHFLGEVTYDEQGVQNVETLLSIAAERLNTVGSVVKAKDGEGNLLFTAAKDNMNPAEAAELGFKAIMQIMPLSNVSLVINRAVTMGTKFMDTCWLTEETESAMEQYSDRAPEHNPVALGSIRLTKEWMPEARQVLVPDSNVHTTIPKVAYTYAIMKEWTEQFALRKMGFHGSVIANAIRELSEQVKPTQCIIAHLGNGCSITAVKDGKVMDTSMGLTPLTGTVMGTRAGDVDPSMLPILAKELDVSVEEVLRLLNKKCGLLGLSGLGSDFRDLLEASEQGHEGAKLAVEVFLYRTCLEISKYQAPIAGMRQLVFSGGIGENSSYVRERICDNFAYLGLKLDKEKNAGRYSSIAKISAEDSHVDVFVIPADEMTEMIRQAVGLLNK